MTEAKLFKCPSCGSSLSPEGDAAEIKCQYCGNTVVVPEEMRTTSSPDTFVSHTYPTSAGGPSTSILGIVVGLVVIVGVVGLVLFGSLLGGGKPAPTVSAKALASSTPAGFAHVVLTFGGQGTGPGLFQDLRHVAVDPSSGNIYADDYRTFRIQKFDSTGKYLNGWTVDQTLCSNKSVTPGRLAADRSGDVYVEFCSNLLKYDGTGKLLANINGDKNSPRDFYRDLLLYPDGGIMVLADSGPDTDVLLHLDPTGKILARYPSLVSNQSGSPANAITLEPAMDGLGNIFLLNRQDYAIYKFDPNGKYVSRFGSVGAAAGQFDTWAHNIAVDNQSRVYVTDFSGLKVYDANGSFLESMKAYFSGDMEMRITEKNEIFIVGGNNMITKLVRNTP